MLKRYISLVAAPGLALTLLLSTNALYAQNGLVDRPYEAVILGGYNFPEFTGKPVDSLYLYAYDEVGQAWQQIPFQIDERGQEGEDGDSSYFIEDDGLLDEDDEIAFYASNGGQQTTTWLEDADSQANFRYEIRLSDPLSGTASYVYLYCSRTLSKTFSEDFVEYIPSPNPNETGEDFVVGESYKIGGGEKGLFGFLSFSNDPENDLLDRQKIRGRTNVIFLPTFDEESGFEYESVRAIDGPVRVIREVVLKLLGSDDIKAPLPFQYFKNSVVLAGNLDIPSELPLGAKITELRHSLDLSANAAGMTFTNEFNPDVLIDGQEDDVDDQAVTDTVGYTHITGTQGTIVTLYRLPSTIGDEQKLFYQDKVDIDDPGDGDAYGDSGILISGDDIEGEFPLALTLVLLQDEQPGSLAQQLAREEAEPLLANVFVQDITTVPVQLAAFTATIEENRVLLSWATSREQGNLGFDVERRSGEGAPWQAVGFVEADAPGGHGEYTYVDPGLQPGVYHYRLKQINLDGSFRYHGTVTALVGLPETFALEQNFPNPFNPSTEIAYQLPANTEAAGARRAWLKIYNLLGQEIRTLVDQNQAPGYYSVTWDGRDDFGREVSSGVYLYRLEYGAFVATRKMALVR